MPEPPSGGSPLAAERPPSDRLDSWKEIAAYFRRDVTTVQRWEKREAMPVHRHLHDRMGSVYAFRSELDGWARSRSVLVDLPEGAQGTVRPSGPESTPDVPSVEGLLQSDARTGAAVGQRAPARARRWGAPALGVAGGVLILSLAIWALTGHPRAPGRLLAEARFRQLTDFEGIEQAAAISRDGRFVAFQSDRDGQMDVWVTQIGTGQFSNLTRGSTLELVNPSVRTLGFSPDGSLVTFWARARRGSGPPEIGIWAAPLLGGPPRPYLEGVAEYDWSGDGERLAYHTPGPGDPMFVRDPGPLSQARSIFTAPAGLHSHFLVWSPDQAFLYFVQGALPDRMDLWRIRPTGGTPERLTHHDAQVSHPVFVDGRTLLYLATDPDGSGPWIQSLDVASNVGHRLGSGLERYTSLSASADGRRIVATEASPKTTLWRLPLAGSRAEMSAAARIPLTTGTGWSPRLGPDFLLYVSSRGSSDSLWKLQAGTATELWSSPEARIVGGAAIQRDGRRIAFTVRQGGRTGLRVVNADGTGARSVGGTLEVQGSPTWAPDGQALTVAALVDGTPRLFRVPLDGRPPEPWLREHSMDPAWSPAGDLLAFSGADVGTTFPVRAVNADGSPSARPPLTLTRGARHLVFLPQGRSLLVLHGEIGHKNLWRIDLDSGLEEPVTDLPPALEVRDFDLSPDGRELVLEQVKEHSDLVLIELPRK